MQTRTIGSGGKAGAEWARANVIGTVALVLTVAIATVVTAQDVEPSLSAGPDPTLPGAAVIDGPGSLEWHRVLTSERGPGTTWLVQALGGVVAVLQPSGQRAELWQSSDGIGWYSRDLPVDLGTVNDALPVEDGLVLITDEDHSDDRWTFDVRSTADGVEWRPRSSTELEVHPNLSGQTRTVLGLHSVPGGLAAFESYAPPASDEPPASLSPSPQASPARAFVWHSPDGQAWERSEVDALGAGAIASGSRIMGGGADGLRMIAASERRPRLLTSADGVRWSDAGEIGHSVEDTGSGTAVGTTRDELLVVARGHDPEPGVPEWAISRGPLDGHWIEMQTLPALSSVDLLIDGRIGIAAGTTAGEGGLEGEGEVRSLLATSKNRGGIWHEQPDVARRDHCLGPLLALDGVALLGAGCFDGGGTSILAARFDSFQTPPNPPRTSIPTAPQALECDFTRSRQGTGPGIYGEGESGWPTPAKAMRVLARDVFVVPRSGYKELARDEVGVLYGYKHKGKVKVAIRVVAGHAPDGGWVAERLSACRIAEFGAKADMGPGVWLWANRWDRTVQERRGPGHCGWESARFLFWTPPGTPETLRATRLFVRDPRGVFRDQWTVPFLRSTTLPSDGRYTGFRRDGRALWLAADERAMYVRDGDRVERWPRVPSGTGCA